VVVQFPTVLEYVNKSNNYKHLHKLFRVAVRFEKNRDLPIPPWILGVLIGDDCLLYQPSICTPDPEVLHEVEKFCAGNGFEITIQPKAGSPAFTINITMPGANRSVPNKLKTALEQIGVWGCRAEGKYVPQIYKISSIENRRELLAGLLDTDGHYHNGGYDWISKSERLADDVVFLSRSLGLGACKAACKKYCQTGAGGTYWRVSITGHTEILPLRIERKQASPRRQKKNPLVTGFKVEPLEEDNFYGFHPMETISISPLILPSIITAARA
jgi:type IV secretion system protein VirB4